ncbi:MAG: sulfatase-like hydrolase/transferase [Parvularculaceae bacterium]|nr:sulfatase-like hydrolase/transferase [Parvularculaceae bacterium]
MFLKRSCAALLAFTALSACDINTRHVPQMAKPNIVMIVADDHGWPYYGFLGNEIVDTPNLDRLALSGSVFTLAHSTSNHCRPTLQSLITGLYPDQYTAQRDALVAAKLAQLPAYQQATAEERAALKLRTEVETLADFTTLPAVLRDAGYVTFQGGKWWEGHYANAHFDAGMSEGWADDEHGQPGWFQQFMGGEGLALGRETMRPLYDFINQNRSQPFFIWYAPSLPHTPLDAPEEFRERYEDLPITDSAKDYYSNISWFDDGVGQLIERLKQEDEFENTLFVFVNDNGWEQPSDAEYTDDRDRYANGGRRGKLSTFDTAFRTPIIISWPGMVPTHEYDYALVSVVDIMPTILSLIDVETPDGLPGHDLEPLLQGMSVTNRDILIGHTTQHRSDSDFRGRLLADTDDLMGHEVDAFYARDRRWHYVWLPEDNQHALYDLENDPIAHLDVADANPDRVADMRAAINDWRAEYLSQ